MIAILAVVVGLWLAALVVLALAGRPSLELGVAQALASDEQIVRTGAEGWQSGLPEAA